MRSELVLTSCLAKIYTPHKPVGVLATVNVISFIVKLDGVSYIVGSLLI